MQPLGTSFKHHVERPRRRPSNPGKPAVANDLGELGLTRLRTQPFAYFLVQRCRHADHSRSVVIKPPNGIHVVFRTIAGNWFDYHPSSVGLQNAMHMTRATPRITHVMHTVEACHEVEAGFLDLLGARLLKAYAVTQPMFDGMSIRLFNGRRVEIVPDKLTFGESLRHQQSRKADAAADIGDLGPRL